MANIFLTDLLGNLVSGNIFPSIEAVFLNGQAYPLEAINSYQIVYYRVTAPNGTPLSEVRSLTVRPDGSYGPVQLAPFTQDQSGEYRVWVSTTPGFDRETCTHFDPFHVLRLPNASPSPSPSPRPSPSPSPRPSPAPGTQPGPAQGPGSSTPGGSGVGPVSPVVIPVIAPAAGPGFAPQPAGVAGGAGAVAGETGNVPASVPVAVLPSRREAVAGESQSLAEGGQGSVTALQPVTGSSTDYAPLIYGAMLLLFAGFCLRRVKLKIR